jgi:hypothetical protein
MNAPYFYISNEKVDHIVKIVGYKNVTVEDCDSTGKIIRLKSIDPVILYRLFNAGRKWEELVAETLDKTYKHFLNL